MVPVLFSFESLTFCVTPAGANTIILRDHFFFLPGKSIPTWEPLQTAWNQRARNNSATTTGKQFLLLLGTHAYKCLKTVFLGRDISSYCCLNLPGNSGHTFACIQCAWGQFCCCFRRVHSAYQGPVNNVIWDLVPTPAGRKELYLNPVNSSCTSNREQCILLPGNTVHTFSGNSAQNLGTVQMLLPGNRVPTTGWETVSFRI